MNDVNIQWDTHKLQNDGKLSWAVYRKNIYGFMTGKNYTIIFVFSFYLRFFFLLDEEANDVQKSDDSYTYAKMILRDKRRWSVADVDGDGLLSKEEFVSFLHPEESVHMKDIVVHETMDDMDKDKDNKISMDEYIGKLYYLYKYI